MRQLLTFSTLAALAALLMVLPAEAHDVKDPVCRMTVDSDTAKYRHKLGNRSFYFCSKQCQVSFSKNPSKYEKLAAQLEKQDLHQYTVDLKTPDTATARRPVQMEFTIRYQDTKELVKEYELIHERLFHLIMVTEDMSWFEHQHPVRGEDGIFRLTWTFPRPGNYRLYADFTPADGDNQVLPIPFSVGGGPARTFPLTPDVKRVKQIGNLRFELKLQGEPLRMEKPVLMTYMIRDGNGRPVRDLQPFIGAMGHLLAISQDGKEVIHTHALQSVSSPSMGAEKEPFRVTRAMVTEKGPTQSFKLTLPSGGLYKTWAQFMHDNRVYTVPFTFLAQDLWGKKAAPARAAAKPGAGNGTQKATIVIDGEYQPAQVSVRAGRPVQLTFVRKEKGGCGEVIQFPSLGVKRTLKPGQKSVVTFTPRKKGKLPFTCGMAMYKGELLVD
jgi:YHS domain-containing protein